jgi:hypothetical protein
MKERMLLLLSLFGFFFSLSFEIEIVFENLHSADVSVYWNRFGFSPDSIGLQYLNHLSQNEKHTFSTHPFHSFEVRESSTGKPLHIIQCTNQNSLFEIQSVHSCGWYDGFEGPALFPQQLTCPIAIWNEYKQFLQITLVNHRAKQFLTLNEELQNQHLATNKRRHYLNEEQPKYTPQYTPYGYEVATLPVRAWKALRGFWDQNRHKMTVEKQQHGDNHMNYWISPTYVLYLPPEIETILVEEIRPLLEKWIGNVPLEFTSFYGIRVYTNNSVLLNHVDRGVTHAISAIIQIDQKVTEDWLLEVWGNDGKKNFLKLLPGQLAFYESARIVHGREIPLNGDYFANAFIHFRPKVGWNVPAL